MSDKNLKHARAVEDYITFFEKLSRRSIPLLDKVAAPNMYFKDPFNEVHDVEDVKRIFEHMFATLDNPRFKVLDHGFSRKNGNVFLHWIFTFQMKGRKREFEGTSIVTFDDQGRAISHIDYWDAAEHVYEHVPILGKVIRHAKSKLAV